MIVCRKVCDIMIKKTTRKIFSLLMAMFMVLPVFAVVPMKADAASTITITIDKVVRKYKEAAKWLGYVNEQRATKKLPALVMDTELLETSMVRAAELSLYADMQRPDGTEFTDEGTEFRSEMFSYGQIINKATIISDSNTTIMSDKVKSIGIGYVEGKGNVKYISILTSENKGNEVDSSVLTQANVTLDQKTECLPKYLEDIELNFSDGKQIQCGSNMVLRYVVTNKADDSCTTYVSSKVKVTSSDNNIFCVNEDNTVLAIQPGNATITMTMIENSMISVRINVTAVSKTFSGCTIAPIPDQLYTGSALTPTVTVTTTSGTVLTAGTHYSLRYYNNIKVGTAGVVITGMGSYASRVGNATFKIIDNPKAFKVTVSANKTEMECGESAKISATAVNGSGTVNYKFEYSESGSSNFSTIQNFSTASSCSFKPTTSAKYNVRVTAKDGAGRVATADMTVNVHAALQCSTSISAATITLGNTVTFNGYASGGVSPYKYRISQRMPSQSSYSVVYDYGTTHSYVCKPTEAGVCDLKIECKDSYGSVVTAVESVKVSGGALVNRSTVSSTSVSLGSAITMTGVATGGYGDYQYAYSYKISTASAWTALKNYSKSATNIFLPSSAGSYSLKIDVKDGAGTVVSKTFNVSIKPNSSTLANNSTISAATVAPNTTVTITGKASGGTSPYRYAYYYKKTSSATWNIKGKEYGTATSVTITPSTATTYDIMVNVEDNTGTVKSKYFTLTVKSNSLVNNSTISTTSTTVGNTVTLKGAASGGKSPYTYAFMYKKSTSDSWSHIGTKYGTATSGTFTPSSAVNYDVMVNVKDASGKVKSKTFTLKVGASTLANNSTISTTSVTLGDSVTLKGAASGGKSPYTYAFMYKKSTSDSWSHIGTKYGTATSGTFTPGSAVNYDVMVNVKDAAGIVRSKTFTLKVTKSVLTNNSTISTTSTTVGNTVTLKGAASGGKSPYTYAFMYKKSTSDSWSHIGTKYGTATSGSFIPGSAVNYDVMVNVKDASGKVKSKTFTLKVGASTLANNSTVSATIVTKGNSVTLKGAASGGAGGYKYAFLYKKASADTWSHIGEKYGTATSASFAPGSNVVYDIMINVKDNGGVVRSKSFKLTVSGGTLVNESTVSATSVTAGTKVSLKGAASGGTSPYKYAFYYKKASSTAWSTAGTAFGTAKSESFTPQSKTVYNVKITVKDETGKTADKTYNVAVQ